MAGMSLGVLDRTPPPFFRQGPSALTKLTFCSALALLLMVADTRFELTQPLRAAAAAALHPLQRALLVPVEAAAAAADYFAGLSQARAREEQARAELARQSERVARADQLVVENQRLRDLLGLRPGLDVRSQAAQILYEAPDPYSRKVIIDRGSSQGVRLALTGDQRGRRAGAGDPCLSARPPRSRCSSTRTPRSRSSTPTRARSAAFGGAAAQAGGMELRFMAANADVQVGDKLHTSGIDGVYPAGLPVAQVVAVDRKVDSGFARILLKPAGRLRWRAPRARAAAHRPCRCRRAPGAGARRAVAKPARSAAGSRRADGERLIMPRSADQLLLPVNPLFVWSTLLVALA